MWFVASTLLAAPGALWATIQLVEWVVKRPDKG